MYLMIFYMFRQLLLEKKIMDLSRILGFFITITMFTGSACFWYILNVGNTVILNGLKYASSRKVFHDILINSRVKKVNCGSIKGRKNGRIIDHEHVGDSIHLVSLSNLFSKKLQNYKRHCYILFGLP